MTSFPNPLLMEAAVRAALDEDLGRAGDITTNAIVPSGAMTAAAIVARRPGVVAGLEFAAVAVRMLHPNVAVDFRVGDGAGVAAGTAVVHISGPARPILAAERVALNYLGRLSGIATLTRRYVEKVAHTPARICCTRKTTPGLRAFEKYAVRCGGGSNHRFGLDDAFLIKDNHIAVAGGIRPALRAAKAHAGHLVKIEIEVDTLDQLAEVIEEGADAVLLDNMTPAQLREAVAMVDGRMTTEASGGVDLDSVAVIAATGVDFISAGALTHSAVALDFGLDIDAAQSALRQKGRRDNRGGRRRKAALSAPPHLPVKSDRIRDVLSFIHARGSARIRDVHQGLRIPAQSMNALMQYLKRRGLVHKAGGANDPSVPYELTPHGGEVLEAMVAREKS